MGACEGARARLRARFWSFGPKVLRPLHGENSGRGAPGRQARCAIAGLPFHAGHMVPTVDKPSTVSCPNFFRASKFFQRVIFYTQVTVVTGYASA